MEFRSFRQCEQNSDLVINSVQNPHILEIHQSNCHQKCFVFTDIELKEITKFDHDNGKIGNGTIGSFSKEIIKNKTDNKRNLRGRKFAIIGISLFTCLVLAVAIPLAMQLRASSLLEARLSFIKRLLHEIPLVEGHWNPDNLTTSLTDIRTGLVGALLWPIRIPCGSQYLDAVQRALEGIDYVKRTANQDNILKIVETVTDIEQAHSDGYVAALIGIQGGHALGASLAVLRSLYILGVRVVSLTQENCDTPWATAARGVDSDKPVKVEEDGVTSFGKIMINEMNRLGILLEVSAASETALKQALAISKAPCVLANTVPLSLCNQSQLTVSDQVLSSLPQNGAVIMVNVDRCADKHLTVKEAISFINHVRNVAGIDHVGLSGATSTYPLLLAELARDRHWGNAAIKKLVGGNLVRALREVERVRDTSLSNEEWISADDLEGHAYCRYPGA